MYAKVKNPVEESFTATRIGAKYAEPLDSKRSDFSDKVSASIYLYAYNYLEFTDNFLL